ncbi:MAG: radical SAM protein [Methylobacter sp.]|nr:MAG: radical SAM protein [Methylobacter sp.]
MGPTGNDVNVIQIHPTKLCNLSCKHCYSSSGPEGFYELPIDAIENFLADAVGEGFNAIGISGGEPFVYSSLPRLLASARSLGFYTTVTTNGLLLNDKKIADLADNISLLAISVDGVPKSHDRLRGLPQALEKMKANLPSLREAGIPFGFIFTLTLENLHELAWVADFAIQEGAQLLQVHPLEQVGRARDYQLLPPDDIELAYAFIEVARLQKLYCDQLKIQFDVADRKLITEEPCRAFAIPTPDLAEVEHLPLAAIVSPLVLQDNGLIVPIQYGFSPEFAIGRLGQQSFSEAAAHWKREVYPHFLELSRNVWAEMTTAADYLPFTNWYGIATTRSHHFAPVAGDSINLPS